MRRIFAVALASAALCVSAHADTISTFSLANISLVGGGTVTGNVVINTTSGVVQSLAAQYVLGAVSDTYALYPSSQRLFNSNTQLVFNGLSASGSQVVFDLALTSLVGYAGGAFCTSAAPCPGNYRSVVNNVNGVSSSYEFNSGQMNFVSSVQTSVTPEPSSLALLGTGVLGVFGAARRRWA